MLINVRNALVLFASLLIGAKCAHGEWVQGPYGPNGTWNVYQLPSTEATWVTAVDLAESTTWEGVPGQLVEVQTPAENYFLEYLTNRANVRSGVWLGITDREGAAPQVTSGNGIRAPQESYTLPNPKVDGWAWRSAAPVTFTNFESSEPINFRGAEDAGMMRVVNGRWNDLDSGYGQDEPVAPALQPNSSLAETRNSQMSYVIEYPVGSAQPLPGVPTLSLPHRLPVITETLPEGNGDLVVTSLRGGFQVPSQGLLVAEAVDALSPSTIAAATKTVHMSRSDAAWKPAKLESTIGGPTIKTPPELLPDGPDNVVNIARAKILVPETALYTFQVFATDGFALQIDDLPFQSAHGAGEIDLLDPSVVHYSRPTLGSTTLATIQLTRGEHHLNFFNWHNGSTLPPIWEITSSIGDMTSGGAHWLALGDGRTLEAGHDRAVAQMIGSTHVVNVVDNSGDFDDDIEIVRQRMSDPQVLANAVARDDVTTLVLTDGAGICCLRPGAELPADQQFVFPIDTQDSAPKKYYSLITGQLSVDDGDEIHDEVIDVTFDVFGQHTLQLHIAGADFVASNLEQAAALDYMVDGDIALTANESGSGITLYGLVRLREGVTYDFDGVQAKAQPAADSGFEVWVAPGNHVNELYFDPVLFHPLSSVLTDKLFPVNRGIAWASDMSGDFNGDQVLDVQDLEAMQSRLGTRDAQYDLNADEIVDLADVESWVHSLKHTWIGDANLDGQFGSDDLVEVFLTGRYETVRPAVWSQGDWTGDGRFNSEDFIYALQDGGYELGAAAAVPEADLNALWMVVCGCVRFGVGRNGRKSTICVADSRCIRD